MVLFGILKELAQKEISDVLEKYSGTKVSPWNYWKKTFAYFDVRDKEEFLVHLKLYFQALVWDEGLTGPFDLVARYQVKRVKINLTNSSFSWLTFSCSFSKRGEWKKCFLSKAINFQSLALKASYLSQDPKLPTWIL
jgi:hypothetical protein